MRRTVGVLTSLQPLPWLCAPFSGLSLSPQDSAVWDQFIPPLFTRSLVYPHGTRLLLTFCFGHLPRLWNVIQSCFVEPHIRSHLPIPILCRAQLSGSLALHQPCPALALPSCLHHRTNPSTLYNKWSPSTERLFLCLNPTAWSKALIKTTQMVQQQHTLTWDYEQNKGLLVAGSGKQN